MAVVLGCAAVQAASDRDDSCSEPPTADAQEAELRAASGKSAESTGPGGGYKFTSKQDLEQIKGQRSAIWDLLRALGSNVLSQGVLVVSSIWKGMAACRLGSSRCVWSCICCIALVHICL